MQYEHDTAQAAEYSREAIERIKREKLPATPDCYELWYVYYSGQSQDVTRAVDILVSNKQKLTEERCRELYQRFLSEGRNEDSIRQAGEQINATIRNVTGVVKDVKSATHKYSDKLGGISGKIGGIKDADELKGILGSVMTDTKAMMEQNAKLEEQLDKSSHVMLELQRDLENVRREAMTDSLTALANRKAFDAAIKRVADESLAAGTTFSLLMIDIDYFKTFNDNYGHQVGDQVLRLVAKSLTDGVKGRDIAARYGGEEFAIILPETGLQGGVLVGNALRKAVSTKDVINRANGEKLARITMSVGVAEYRSGENLSDLIERADAALYTAKHNGRNQVAAAPTPGKKQKKETA